MSWPVQNTGPWGTGMPMTPAMNMGAMGSYSAEQWAAVQQQNWQQWAQWQQQYAQWQSQYGEKYAQQMQAMQAMGGMPPLPTNAAPPVPAPPPPEQPPPPPPPHENNQPLYGSASKTPAPVPPPTQNRQTNPNLTTVNVTGNNQWSYGTQAPPSATAATTPAPAVATPAAAIDSEALKKLAEEEKLFDIQFQKWEEEIDKWRRENVNHPDKQAYKEYEEKFEACRAQLLERRQQMKLKRARLTNVNPNTPMTGNAPTPVPPTTLQNAPSNSYAQNKSQSYNNKQDQSRTNQNAPYQQPFNKHYNNSAPPVAYSKGNVDPQDRYESYQDGDNYTTGGDYSARDNYSGNNNYSGNDNYSGNNDYSGNDNYSAVDRDGNDQTDNSSFLPTSGATKNIPGLDLVPDTDKVAIPQQDVIDITEEQERASYIQSQQQTIQPDYSKISKGINNILGDEKIMNILSMVRGQTAPSNNQGVQSMANMPYNNQNNQMNNQWNRNESNQQYNDNQQYNENHQHSNSQQCDDNPQYDNNAPYGNRPNNMPFNNRQQPNYPMQQNQGQFNRFPPNQRRMYDDHPANQNQDQYYDENDQYDMQNMPPRNDQPPMRHNAPGPRPLMELSMPLNENQYKGPPIRRIPENVRPPSPPRRKWIEEPLFTPSIIVEYEHKPLRVKARDFIEPVHTFDYNHISKDGENKKKDFEREADALFARKPRRDSHPPEYISQDRYAKDMYSRDFERRVPREREELREDYRFKSLRNEYEERRRPDDRYEDRRRDDRYGRRDDNPRDWERERQRDWERDRDLYRERPKEREFGRRDDGRVRSRSRDKDTRKREHSKERFEPDAAKKTKEVKNVEEVSDPKHTVMIDDLLESPGREIRPSKIVIILRGPPGSGKSYLAKLIRDKEAEYGGTARIMSIDDYFMQEGEVEEKDPATGKMVKKPTLKYEYDEKLEETYLNSLKRAFKRSLTDGYFTFLIYDAVNEHHRQFADIWNYARQNGFQVYVCTMEIDSQLCYKRNIHNRTMEDIEVICTRFFPTPSQYIQLDATTLLQSAAITEVHMEDVEDDVVMEDAEETERGSTASVSRSGPRNSPWKTTCN